MEFGSHSGSCLFSQHYPRSNRYLKAGNREQREGMQAQTKETFDPSWPAFTGKSDPAVRGTYYNMEPALKSSHCEKIWLQQALVDASVNKLPFPQPVWYQLCHSKKYKYCWEIEISKPHFSSGMLGILLDALVSGAAVMKTCQHICEIQSRFGFLYPPWRSLMAYKENLLEMTQPRVCLNLRFGGLFLPPYDIQVTRAFLFVIVAQHGEFHKVLFPIIVPQYEKLNLEKVFMFCNSMPWLHCFLLVLLLIFNN